MVDDDPTVADLIHDLLDEQGHSVHGRAQSRATPAQLLGEHRADLMITDLDLPGMSGWQLASASARSSPIFSSGLITGWAARRLRAGAQARGVDFVLDQALFGRLASRGGRAREKDRGLG